MPATATSNTAAMAQAALIRGRDGGLDSTGGASVVASTGNVATALNDGSALSGAGNGSDGWERPEPLEGRCSIHSVSSFVYAYTPPRVPGSRCTGRARSRSQRFTFRSSRSKNVAIDFQESSRRLSVRLSVSCGIGANAPKCPELSLVLIWGSVP